MSDKSKTVRVEIFGQMYPIRARVDSEEYVKKIAAYVDTRMREIDDEMSPATSLGVAILAALNIADDLFSTRESSQHDARIVESKIKKYSQALTVGLEQSK
ncbi:cell division protein ZapA [bacterium]|nr:cell division protein ZapA [bacterium]